MCPLSNAVALGQPAGIMFGAALTGYRRRGGGACARTAGRRNNPAGFAAAPEFWEFFESHPLPK